MWHVNATLVRMFPGMQKDPLAGSFAFACGKGLSLLGGSFRCSFLGGFLGLWCCGFLGRCSFYGHGQTLGGSGFALRAAARCLGFALASGCAGLLLDLLALSAHCGLLVCHGSVGLAARIERGRGRLPRNAVGLSTTRCCTQEWEGSGITPFWHSFGWRHPAAQVPMQPKNGEACLWHLSILVSSKHKQSLPVRQFQRPNHLDNSTRN